MSQMPRFAVGTVQPDVDHQPLLWALLHLLKNAGLAPQSFLSQARFCEHDGAASITGEGPRHLDSWLMTRDVCQEIFLHGGRNCGVAVVEGQYGAASIAPRGGSLDTLCDWLDLSPLVLLDASRLSPCRLPALPAGVEGLLLDRAPTGRAAAELRTALETLCNVPVLGMLEDDPGLRRPLAALPHGGKPTREQYARLSQQLAPRLDLPRLLEIAADRRALFPFASGEFGFSLGKERAANRLNVAVAYDEAFDCYFPDTLDLLEARGACLTVFSPLVDDRLPHPTDVVYFGCGQAERFAARLAENHCLLQALRNHAQSGGRVYAEGSGLAYLCRSVILRDGRQIPLAGVLPAVARQNATSEPPETVEMTLSRGTWLGEASCRLRGYRNSHWQIEPSPGVDLLAADSTSHDLLVWRHVIGSRVHLNFAAQPRFLRNFFEPAQLSVER